MILQTKISVEAMREHCNVSLFPLQDFGFKVVVKLGNVARPNARSFCKHGKVGFHFSVQLCLKLIHLQ
jgi:hypothetical protein